jgi:hypothetical protein
MKKNFGFVAAMVSALVAGYHMPLLAADYPETDTVVQINAPIPVIQDEILLETLDTPDQFILTDILLGYTNGKSKPWCPNQVQECKDFVIASWFREMTTKPLRIMFVDIPARRALLSELKGKPPHVQEQVIDAAFHKQYAKVKDSLQGKSICYLYKPWKLNYSEGKYLLSKENVGTRNQFHLAFSEALYGTSGPARSVMGTKVYPSKNGKFVVPISPTVMGDANYTRFAKYADVPWGPTRPVLKICGMPRDWYSRPLNPGEPVGPEPIEILFELSKPIEVVQPPSMKRIDTIPLEWLK